jgi:hypothetical protein
MAFFWMLYCVKRPDCPVTTCWIGAGMTTSSMSSYVCRGFHSFGGMIYKMERGVSNIPPVGSLSPQPKAFIKGPQRVLVPAETEIQPQRLPAGPSAAGLGPGQPGTFPGTRANPVMYLHGHKLSKHLGLGLCVLRAQDLGNLF